MPFLNAGTVHYRTIITMFYRSVTIFTSWRQCVCPSTPRSACPARPGRCWPTCGWGRSWSSPSACSRVISISSVTPHRESCTPMTWQSCKIWSKIEIGLPTPGVNNFNFFQSYLIQNLLQILSLSAELQGDPSSQFLVVFTDQVWRQMWSWRCSGYSF